MTTCETCSTPINRHLPIPICTPCAKQIVNRWNFVLPLLPRPDAVPVVAEPRVEPIVVRTVPVMPPPKPVLTKPPEISKDVCRQCGYTNGHTARCPRHKSNRATQ